MLPSTPDTGNSSSSCSSSSSCPATVRVLGRSQNQENGDICGDYRCVGHRSGSAIYQKYGSAMAIRFWQPMRRWVIDREGVRDSEVCVAYADDTSGCQHPAHTELIWNIWDSGAQAHVPDPGVMVVDAPPVVAFVGRSPEAGNSALNGEYDLLEMCHGRPAYRHRSRGTVLRYYEPDDRWLASAASESGTMCSAFADALGTPHPGFSGLRWNFWDAEKGAFMVDPAVAVLVAPALLHVIGRNPKAENARICGTYHLAGARDGRPVYFQQATRSVIRYAAKHDWWLIDCDNEEPSLTSKLYHWILNGDASAASDTCAAFAEARGTDHPGYSSLEWKVWDSNAGRHELDVWVRSTTAPLVLRVSGRGHLRENCDINGDYSLAGTHLGRPAYQKPGQRAAVRYWPALRRWVIDREGLRNSDSCVAFADCDAENPSGRGFLWQVFESSRGRHLPDPTVVVSVPPEAPRQLPEPELSLKRKAAELQEPPAPKRMRWLTGLFGGA